jgi:hypothetical protein
MAILLLSFFTITTISLVLFTWGTKSGKTENEPVYLMAAIGSKFLLAAVFSIIWFISLKNTALEFIILFFLLYLAFTFYLVRTMLNNLKVRSLKQE